MKRGDVVLVDFPFSTGLGSKKRPALVVQCDLNNLRLHDTIVAIITSNLAASHQATQYTIDSTHPELGDLWAETTLGCEVRTPIHVSPKADPADDWPTVGGDNASSQ
jgi:mRNA-degrading endonuclease toxin of MazEF toxin-antitoxin module